MREDQIVAAAMDVDLLPEMFHTHRRALDMPAGSAPAPRAFPERFARLGRLPEREIGRRLLAFVDADTVTGNHILEITARKLAIVWVGRDAEVDVAIHDIRMVAFDQA